MIYTGIGEAIELIESRDKYPTVAALKMAVGKLRQEQGIMAELQAKLQAKDRMLFAIRRLARSRNYHDIARLINNIIEQPKLLNK